ncbi:MAG: alanine racemase [Clostridiales bacterium]|nr:alanine racemase [Clostridiales bacterium]
MYSLNRAWAEVNLDAIKHNLKEIRRITNKNAEICGVVKADAYGHGFLEVARTLIENGVTYLAVSMLDEAIQLRKQGINTPILILSYTDPVRCDEIVLNGITQTVFSYDLAKALSDAARRLNKNVKIHIKIDTGMGRVGFLTGYSSIKTIIDICKLPNLIVEGIFTHFASADEKDQTYTYMQFEKFMNICNELKRVGIFIPIKHVCNSAGIMEFPHMHLDMVRPGIILYGLYPSDEVDKRKLNLIPAMTLKANITLVKDVEYGTCISYGRIFKTLRKSKIATIPIGYADGYLRTLTNKARVLINGQFAPIVGKICMDQCMADVTDIVGDIRCGQQAVLIGEQGENSISIDEIAKDLGTVNYEVACVIGKRIPRFYVSNDKIYSVLNYLVEMDNYTERNIYGQHIQ